jgi:outer membrane protein TolC
MSRTAAPEVLTVDDAVRIALRQHPAIREAEAAVAAAEAAVRQARAAYFPQLSFSAIIKAGLSGATGALGLPGFPASPAYHEDAYSLNWYQTIFDFGRIKHSVAARRALYRSAQFRQDEEEARIALEVKRAYLTVLDAQQLAEVAARTVEQRHLASVRAKAYAQADLQSNLDVERTDASLAEAEAAQIHARDSVETAFAALRAAMGATDTRSYALTAPLFVQVSLPALEDLIARAVKTRPDAQAVAFKIAALGERLSGTRAEALPELRGFAAAGHGNFTNTTVPENQRHGVAGVGALVPIFTGGRLKAERDAAQAELDGAKAAGNLLQQQIRVEITGAYYELEDLPSQVEALRKLQAAAQAALRLAEARRMAQLESTLDVLTARIAVANTDANYTHAQMEYARAVAQLQFGTGTPPRP